MKVKRGKLLTVMLIIFAIGYLTDIYKHITKNDFLSIGGKMALFEVSPITVFMIISVLGFIGVVGLWLRKKWAAYLAIGVLIASLLELTFPIYYLIIQYSKGNMLTGAFVTMNVVINLLFFFAIYRKWKYFTF